MTCSFLRGNVRPLALLACGVMHCNYYFIIIVLIIRNVSLNFLKGAWRISDLQSAVCTGQKISFHFCGGLRLCLREDRIKYIDCELETEQDDTASLTTHSRMKFNEHGHATE